MKRAEMKNIVETHPGWATCVVYGNNHNLRQRVWQKVGLDNERIHLCFGMDSGVFGVPSRLAFGIRPLVLLSHSALRVSVGK